MQAKTLSVAGASPSDQPPPHIARGALKLKHAAAYLDISVISLRRLIERGLIKPNRALRHVVIPVIELDRFLRS